MSNGWFNFLLPLMIIAALAWTSLLAWAIMRVVLHFTGGS